MVRLFDPCDEYERDQMFSGGDREADCVTCARQYGDQVCPIFRARLLKCTELKEEDDARRD